MKVLRLSNSDDSELSGIAPEQRASHIAEQVLAEAASEPVETVTRPIWPSEQLPDLIDGWIGRYEPDLVFFQVNGFWYLYRSVPLLLQRRLGRLGRALAATGERAGRTPWIVRTRPYHWSRWLLLRTVGGATYFTREQVLETTDRCLRRVVQHEDVAVVVRGPGQGGFWRNASREDLVWMHLQLEALCRRLHLHYLGSDPREAKESLGFWSGGDRVHRSAAGHAFYGGLEGEAMAAAWRAHCDGRGERLP